jgi:actin-related protein
MTDDPPSVVIDNGSHRIFAGRGGEDAPDLLIPPIVGRPRLPLPTSSNISTSAVATSLSTLSSSSSSVSTGICVGDMALEKRGQLTLNGACIEKRMINNWDDIEIIWDYIFTTLRRPPTDNRVLLTEPPLNPKANREKMAIIMFETFHVPHLYLANQTPLALFASGRTTGLVIDSGHNMTHIVPIYEGHALSHAISQMQLGGSDIMDYLIRLLADRGHHFTTPSSQQSIAFDILKQHAYVAVDYNEELKSPRVKDYELPGYYHFLL